MTIVHSSEQCNPEQILRHLTSLVENLEAMFKHLPKSARPSTESNELF